MRSNVIKEQDVVMNVYIIVEWLVCFGFQLFVKVTDHFLLSTAHIDLRSFLSEEVNGLTRTKVVALHGNKGTWMTTIRWWARLLSS